MSRKIRRRISIIALAALALPALGRDWRFTFQSAKVSLLPDDFYSGAESEARDINILNIVNEVVGAVSAGEFDRAFHWHPSTGFATLGYELAASRRVS